MLGPLLFTIYPPQIIHHYSLNFYYYADDTQLFLSISLSTQLPQQSLVKFSHAIKTWMTTKLLETHQ